MICFYEILKIISIKILFKIFYLGFSFSPDEQTALVQFQGGPCAVIVPVQAYILKNIITTRSESDDWRQVSLYYTEIRKTPYLLLINISASQADIEKQNNLLIDAFSEILTKAFNGCQYCIVHTLNKEVVDKPQNLDFTHFHSSLR